MVMGTMDKHRIGLEEKHETQHLPANVRERLYRMAHARQYVYGLGAIALEYEDISDLAKMAYSAGHDAARTVCELEQGGHDADARERDVLRSALESVLRSSQTVDSYDGIRAACKRVGLTIDSHGDCTWTGAKP